MIRGCSPQMTSRMIPPKVAVMRPETTHNVGAKPRFAATCTPTMQKAANPSASEVHIGTAESTSNPNFASSFGHKKNVKSAVIKLISMYNGVCIQKTTCSSPPPIIKTSRRVPPPVAVMQAIIIIPIRSIPFLPAFRAPENAKTVVPNMSNVSISRLTLQEESASVTSPPRSRCRAVVAAEPCSCLLIRRKSSWVVIFSEPSPLDKNKEAVLLLRAFHREPYR
mmetsp:Transcript_23942/g.56557  ORF Transcript_23942/g.56557 Transcript_23942/m.56557 type:complete len:223 (+) Transcript_23942:1873-2541(+)